jgi:hypothetical protein
MSHRLARALIVGALTAACALAAGVSAAGARQPAITVPPIPTPPPAPPNVRIPGEKVEKFELVFEGNSHADRIANVSGPGTGGCDVSLHAEIAEGVSFGRGKGVTMEFVRYKQNGHNHYAFQRSGRKLDSSFNVVAQITRQATGSGDLTQHPNSVPCAPQHFDVNGNPDCGKTKTSNNAWGLKVKGTAFSPTPRAGGVVSPPDHCGEPPQGSAFTTNLADLLDGWPTPADLPFEPIPFRKMFNPRYHAFKVEFRTPEDPLSSPLAIGLAQGTEDDNGWTEATVRFIRQ